MKLSIFLGLLVALLILFMPLSAQATTVECSDCSSCNSTIATAGEGDIIILNTTVTNHSGICLRIYNDNLTFRCASGVKMGGQETGAGIYTTGSADYVNIENCFIEDFANNIYLDGCDYCNLTNLTLYSAPSGGYGIYGYRPDYLRMENINASYNGFYGIRFIYGDWIVMNNITANDNGGDDGILIDEAHNLTATNIVANNNNRYGYYTFAWTTGAWQVIENLTTNDNSYCANFDYDYMNLTNWECKDSASDGSIISISNSNFENINVSNNGRYGLYMTSAPLNRVTNATILGNNNWAIYIQYGTGNNFTNVYVDGGSVNAVYVKNNAEGSFFNSQLTSTTDDIYISSGNVNLYNTTFTGDYDITGTGQLNVHWYLNYTNPYDASVTLKNASGNVKHSFSNNQTDLVMREYYVIATDQSLNSTPHLMEATKGGYNDKSENITMNTNQEYVLSMSPSGVIYSCGSLSADTIYVMNQSIIDHTGSDCFTVLGDNVTLDCAGFTVDSGDSSYRAFQSTGYDDLTVYDCVFTDWDGCLHFENADNLNMSYNNMSGISGFSFVNSTNIYALGNRIVNDISAGGCGYMWNVSGVIFRNNYLNNTNDTSSQVIHMNDYVNNTIIDNNEFYGYCEYSALSSRNMQWKNATISNNIFNTTGCNNIALGGAMDYDKEKSINVTINNNVLYSAGYDAITSFYGIHNLIIRDNILENFDTGIYLQYAWNVTLDNLTIVPIYDYSWGIYLRDSGNMTVNDISSDHADMVLYVHNATNVNISNVDINNSARWGVYLRYVSNVIFRDSSVKNSGNVDLRTFKENCHTQTITNITGTGDLPIELYKTPTTVQDKELSQLIICNTSAVIDNVTSDVGATGIQLFGAYDVNITDTTVNNGYMGLWLDRATNIRVDNFNSQGCDYGIYFTDDSDADIYDSSIYYTLVDGGDLNIYTSNLTGNLSAIDMDNYYSDSIINVYDSEISRTSTDNTSGAVYLYGDGGYNNIANLYNTTLEDYYINSSQLNVYWYLDVTNPRYASAVIKNASDDTIDSFSGYSTQLTLREYYVTPVNQRFNSTPHSLGASKGGYQPISVYVTMNESGSYTIQLAVTGVGIEALLSETGSGLGGFLTSIQDPLITLIIMLGIIGGILAIFYGIATAIKRATSGQTSLE